MSSLPEVLIPLLAWPPAHSGASEWSGVPAVHGRYLWQALFFPNPNQTYSRTITAKIVAAIEAGAGTYTMPWHGGIVPPAFPINAATDMPYRGINSCALGRCDVQAIHLGILGQLSPMANSWCAGPQGRTRVANRLLQETRTQRCVAGGEDEKPRFVARASYVFNAEQVDGWRPTHSKAMV